MAEVPQHMLALENAQRIRLARAATRGELRNETITIAEALERPCVASMLVLDLLRAQRRWGERRASKALLRAGVQSTRSVERLTARQREALVAVVTSEQGAYR